MLSANSMFSELKSSTLASIKSLLHKRATSFD
jgi:hypothetical protein